ncbi:MAG: DNA polymerase I [Chlamydiia bacterium]|nr:DNA polymerase I [Chlamydiia bacterium]
MTREKLYIIDGTSYLFRGYFAIRKMTNDKGESTNALFGLIRSVQKMIKDFAPSHMVCVFDGPDNKKSRKEIYEDYKAHRDECPEDLIPQIAHAHRFCKLAGVPEITVAGVEADDTIGSIAHWGAQNGYDVYICSSDKDLAQMVGDYIRLIHTHKENLVIDHEKVIEIFGVRPDQIRDYLALVGDKSDNIPGLAGVGPKTAATMLGQMDHVEELIEKADELSNKKLAEKVKNGADDIILSKKLATIQLDVPFPQDAAFLSLDPPDVDGLRELYREMKFNTFLKELDKPVADTKAKELPKIERKTDYFLIDSAEDLTQLVDLLLGHKEVCIEVVGNDENPHVSEIVGMAFGYEEAIAWYVPFNQGLDQDLLFREISRLLDSPIRFFSHNIKYQLHLLDQSGFKLPPIGFDTMIASYVLAAHSHRHTLEHLMFAEFEHVKIPKKQLVKSGKSLIFMGNVKPEKVASYVCEAVDFTIQLKKRYEERLKIEGTESIFSTIEMPLLSVLYEMEKNGIYLEKGRLADLSTILNERIAKYTEEIHHVAGEEINLNSPKQLSALLFEKLGIRKIGRKGPMGYSTGIEVLEQLKGEHPVIDLVILYRQAEKLRSTYVDSLPGHINPRDNRIHPSFQQSVAATGRLSCVHPNLQNIPTRTAEGKKIREAFVPQEKGWSYLSCDYSQIELRIMAHLSDDPHLINAFEQDQDIHRSTAALIFGVGEDEVTRDMRHAAKAVNFGIMYGQQAFGLAKELKVDIKEAAQFIETYFAKMPNVADFIEKSKEKARQTGYAETLFGRRRLIAEIHSKNGMHRAMAERLAVNSPIQGLQSDIIKRAMIEIHKEMVRVGARSKMIIQIHDELFFECPDEELEQMKEIVLAKMEAAYSLRVPLKVDMKVGKNWAEC